MKTIRNVHYLRRGDSLQWFAVIWPSGKNHGDETDAILARKAFAGWIQKIEEESSQSGNGAAAYNQCGGVYVGNRFHKVSSG